jgi:hypothetical protein
VRTFTVIAGGLPGEQAPQRQWISPEVIFDTVHMLVSVPVNALIDARVSMHRSGECRLGRRWISAAIG